MSGDFARATSGGSAAKAHAKGTAEAAAAADRPCGAAVAAVTNTDRFARDNQTLGTRLKTTPIATRNLTPWRRPTCKHK